jgi:ribonucleoside-diphosphate reductase alpha chain
MPSVNTQEQTQKNLNPVSQSSQLPPFCCKVIRRNGQVTDFDGAKIQVAMTKAFLEVEGNQASGSARIHDTVLSLTQQVIAALKRRTPEGGMVNIEEIQDQVELALMRAGEHKVARRYVLYREERAKLRAEKDAKAKKKGKKTETIIHVKTASGELKPLGENRLRALINEAVEGLAGVSAEQVLQATMRNLYDGISEKEVATALIISTRVLIDREPNYTYVTARMLMDSLRREALSFIEGQVTEATQHEMVELYPEIFAKTIKRGVQVERLADELGRYDLTKLGAALKPERDLQFTYLGLQTLYDRYFLHHDGIRFELPQVFFMRVAMGLAINEVEREDRAIEFYNLLSSFDFMSSTPTLFNSGTLRPQLSSCYLTTVPDDLDGIYNAIKDNALLSKYAGGLGNDWTRVRGMGSHIKGTNGKSQGVVPFLKVANDTAVAVNQCFAPDTYLHTANGIKVIREVKTGDLVLGISGTYREVQQAMVYNQHDAMVAIDIKHAVEPVKVTAGHPFYALRSIPMGQAVERSYAQLANAKVRPEWVEAGQLQKGDYIAQVIPTETVLVDGFTAEDARLYGILLGDGHMSKDTYEWGVSGNPQSDNHLSFVRDYLATRGIHYWETARGDTYIQIRWASGQGAVRDGTTGRIVGAGAATLPFTYGDLYNAQGEKRIARKFSHLPHSQTLSLIQGLLETDGGVSRGKEIYFTSTSRELAEGLRYQCLRLGIPTAGQYRERDNKHSATRSDGSTIEFKGITKAFDIRIPAVKAIAELVDCQPLTKQNWLTYNGCVYSRVRSIETITTLPFVFDLIVEGDESYMTTAGLAHNGGKRKGAVCAYLETWHIDIEDFLELRKNTGDERRRTHDMNTANWIPDLFMKRVAQEGEWTLFSPDDVPDLHELTGKAFEARYVEYEAKAARGEIKLTRKLPALQLWRKMLGMLFETGHPWITFKDPCNVRYSNQHVGLVHSSNLCTEIALHTTDGEIAVCFPAGTQILTRDGQRAIEDCDGREVFVPFSENLQAQERFLKARLIVQGEKPVYELQTKNGIVIEATAEHPFLVQHPIDHDKPRTYKWKKLKDLEIGDFIVCPNTANIYGTLEHQDEDYTAAGWMLGDGWMSSSYGVCFAPHEKYAQEFVLPVLNKWHQGSELGFNAPHTNAPTPYVQPNGVVNWHSQRQGFINYVEKQFGFTRAIGGQKRISSVISQAEPNQIASFLSGLFSADGCVMHDSRRKKGGVIVSLASASLGLLRDVQLLLKPFGIHGRVRGCEVSGREGRWQGQYEIRGADSIRNFGDIIGFGLCPDKSALLQQYLPLLSKKSAFLHTALVSIKPTGIKPVFDLSLEEDHSFIANGLVVHNCNLGSVNLPQHINNGELDIAKLEHTVTTAMRMLDNVIDYNYYSVPQARKSNLRHRPVGMGIMGFQDALYKMNLAYTTSDALEFADRSMEAVSYFAIRASSNLAAERGKYSTYNGSLWSKGILPIDSLQLMAEERGSYFNVDTTQRMDWNGLRHVVKQQGMRNSNVMAIAPTATISNICGVSQSIEPTYQNLFVKSNLSGEFTVINPYLVEDLKALDLWDEVMINDLKYFDGSVQPIDRIPDAIKAKYATAFEMDARWLVEAASRRQKWIDQGQSLNLYMKEPNGQKLDNLYKLAWVRGLKTTYYLRTLGATGAEKTSTDDVPVATTKTGIKSATNYVSVGSEAPKACSILDPDCEACQ